jgi:hypothetical protein
MDTLNVLEAGLWWSHPLLAVWVLLVSSHRRVLLAAEEGEVGVVVEDATVQGLDSQGMLVVRAGLCRHQLPA